MIYLVSEDIGELKKKTSTNGDKTDLEKIKKDIEELGDTYAITIKEFEELVKKSFATTNDKFDKINMTLDELMKNNSVEGIDAVKKSIKGL